MWIDTHCHLDAPAFSETRDAIWREAQAHGVHAALVPAVHAANFDAVAACCARYSGLFPAYGVHPLYVHSASENDLALLRLRLKNERPLAIGEIGLDGYVKDAHFSWQEFFFQEQLKLARDFDLPVVLHVRHAVDCVLKHLRRLPVKGGIAHAFNGSRQQAEMFLKLGFKLGFGGAMTYPGSRRIRALAAELPLSALVLETDAPDLAPVWARGQSNRPGELPAIGRVLAELRDMPESELAAALAENTRASLGPEIG